MNELSWVKVAGEFGLTGVVLVALILFYRLADKYGDAFLGAQKAQAAAMASLAGAVKDSTTDQREVLIAVRVLAERIDTQKKYLESIEKEVLEFQRRCAA